MQEIYKLWSAVHQTVYIPISYSSACIIFSFCQTIHPFTQVSQEQVDKFNKNSADIPSFKLRATANSPRPLKYRVYLNGTKKSDFLTINFVPDAYNCPSGKWFVPFTPQNTTVCITSLNIKHNTYYFPSSHLYTCLMNEINSLVSTNVSYGLGYIKGRYFLIILLL